MMQSGPMPSEARMCTVSLVPSPITAPASTRAVGCMRPWTSLPAEVLRGIASGPLMVTQPPCFREVYAAWMTSTPAMASALKSAAVRSLEPGCRSRIWPERPRPYNPWPKPTQSALDFCLWQDCCPSDKNGAIGPADPDEGIGVLVQARQIDVSGRSAFGVNEQVRRILHRNILDAGPVVVSTISPRYRTMSTVTFMLRAFQ